MSLTFPEKLDRFPPVVIRLLARRIVDGCKRSLRALTDREVSAHSGLPLGEITYLSKLTSWERVEIATYIAYCKGCGADLDSRDWLRKNTAYMTGLNAMPRYLLESPDWEKTFQPLVRIAFESETHPK